MKKSPDAPLPNHLHNPTIVLSRCGQCLPSINCSASRRSASNSGWMAAYCKRKSVLLGLACRVFHPSRSLAQRLPRFFHLFQLVPIHREKEPLAAHVIAFQGLDLRERGETVLPAISPITNHGERVPIFGDFRLELGCPRSMLIGNLEVA